jgi:hypothetical protein
MSQLPGVVAQYQDAHDRGDVETALSFFTSSATVKDDGHEYHGPDDIRDSLARASTEFTYTRTLTGADAVDAKTRLVTNHLEGSFPGGVVDLRYRCGHGPLVVSDVSGGANASPLARVRAAREWVGPRDGAVAAQEPAHLRSRRCGSRRTSPRRVRSW